MWLQGLSLRARERWMHSAAPALLPDAGMLYPDLRPFLGHSDHICGRLESVAPV